MSDTKERQYPPKCNCHEWAVLGSACCPKHGHENKYRIKIESKSTRKVAK